jgi:hypothetical protein
MTWLKIDDKLTSHPKWVGLGLQAKSLWFHTSVWAAAHNTDGVVPEHVLPMLGFTSSLAAHEVQPATEQLVRAKLWRRLPKARGGGHEICNWLEYQPSRQQVQAKQEADANRDERKRLHDWLHKSPIGRRVKDRIIDRDGIWCRYCGEQCIVSGDRRSPARRTFDLIDPASVWDRSGTPLPAEEISRIAGLWVVACGWCNAVKNSRTPDEADMRILPAPRPAAICRDLPRSAANGSRAVRDPGSDLVGSALVGPIRGQVVAGQFGAPTVSGQEANGMEVGS